MDTNQELVQYLKKIEVLRTSRIIEAFEKIDRVDFVLPQDKKHAYANIPFSIGYGQTISQPLTVAFMLERLWPRDGDKILDIGSGSGWTTALLAQIVGNAGEVIGLEIIPELVKFGSENLGKYNFGNAEIRSVKKNILGSPDEKFDKILVSAAAKEFPEELLDRLKDGGSMIIPVRNSIIEIHKDKEGNVEKKEIPGFVFVPLV